MKFAKLGLRHISKDGWWFSRRVFINVLTELLDMASTVFVEVLVLGLVVVDWA